MQTEFVNPACSQASYRLLITLKTSAEAIETKILYCRSGAQTEKKPGLLSLVRPNTLAKFVLESPSNYARSYCMSSAKF